MEKSMRAALIRAFGGPENIRIETLPVPPVQEGEVLIQVMAAGVNPVDTELRAGLLKEVLPYEFPLVLGWDVAGIVADTGYSARRFEIGEGVYGFVRRPVVRYGSYAEYLVIPETYLAHVPQQVSFAEAAGIPLAGLTAYQCLFDAGALLQHQTVLILGASGGVGSLAVQLAKYQDAVVIGVASTANQDFLASLGADHTIDYQRQHVGDAARALFPDGVDLVVDCTGGDTRQQSLRALKPGGKLVSTLAKDEALDAAVDFQQVHAEPNSLHLDHLRDLTDAGLLHIPVTQVFPLEEAAAAHRQIETHHTRGKIAIVP